MRKSLIGIILLVVAVAVLDVIHGKVTIFNGQRYCEDTWGNMYSDFSGGLQPGDECYVAVE